MPSDIYSFYEQTMEQINRQSTSRSQLAKKVLSFLADELAEAVAIEPRMKELIKEKIPARSILVNVCRGLAAVDDNSGIIRLAHSTVELSNMRFEQLSIT
jgi:hypothetical protein